MNRRSVPAWLLAASLALNAGIVVAVALHQWQQPPKVQATQPSPVNLPDYLELSAEQRQRWQQLEPNFLRDVTANWAEIQIGRASCTERL